jgi:uncharacterized protein involved in exopolysaccharide biosynthesis
MLSQQVVAWESSQKGQNPETLEQQVAKEQEELLSLRERYTDEYPDVVKLKNDVAELQKRIQDASAKKQQQPNEPRAKGLPIEPPEIQQLRAQLHQAELAVIQKQEEQKHLQGQIGTLQGRLQLSPKIQQQFKSLTRDYQTALEFYNDLLKKRNESQMATELEHRQQGEQFRVLDAPSFPERPSFPNRPLFGSGGLGAGLIVGLGLVQLSEWRDKSMRSRHDVEIYLRLPTLAQISLMKPNLPRKNGNSRLAPMKQAMSKLDASSGRR